MEPAENPRQSSSNADQGPAALLAQMHQVLMDVSATRRRFMEQAATAHRQSQSLEDAAVEALKADRVDLARSALRRRAIVTAEIASLDQHIAEIQTEEERLSLSSRTCGRRSKRFTPGSKSPLPAKPQPAHRSASARRSTACRMNCSTWRWNSIGTNRTRTSCKREQTRSPISRQADRSSSPILSSVAHPTRRITQPVTSADIESQLELLRRELSSGSDPQADARDTPQG